MLRKTVITTLKEKKVYPNLSRKVIVRLTHPRSGDSHGQETLFAPSADKQTHNYDTDCSNHHSSQSPITIRHWDWSVARWNSELYISKFTKKRNIETTPSPEKNSIIPPKRKRDELTPTILVEQTSTSTLVGEEDNETTNCSRQLGSSDKNKEQIALKLNRLKDKAVRYKSHKDFLSQCIAEEPVPKDLELELGHRIGNYD